MCYCISPHVSVSSKHWKKKTHSEKKADPIFLSFFPKVKEENSGHSPMTSWASSRKRSLQGPHPAEFSTHTLIIRSLRGFHVVRLAFVSCTIISPWVQMTTNCELSYKASNVKLHLQTRTLPNLYFTASVTRAGNCDFWVLAQFCLRFGLLSWLSSPKNC